MGSANGFGSGRRFRKPGHSTLKTNGMARAIRGALALTTVALAMSGSGGAFAAVGVCTPAGSTIACDGVFNPVNGNVPITYSVEDLTLVLGQVDPTTTVTVNAGPYAVDLNGTTGAETLSNYAAITNYGGSAITINTDSGNITVDNFNDVLANGSSFGATAYAIYANTIDGIIDIDNQGTLTVNNNYNNGYGVEAYSQNGNVTVNSDGDVYIDTSGNAYGLRAETDYGQASVTSSGTIEVTTNSNAYGAYATSY